MNEDVDSGCSENEEGFICFETCNKDFCNDSDFAFELAYNSTYLNPNSPVNNARPLLSCFEGQLRGWELDRNDETKIVDNVVTCEKKPDQSCYIAKSVTTGNRL